MENEVCRYCQSNNLLTRDKPPHIELYCGDCGRHQKFVPKNIQPEKRPRLARGTTDEIWEGADNRCAHCNLNSEHIELLGLHRTVQHVPAFKENGHEGYLIPLCSWCQQHSATRMKQLEALIKRLSEKFSMK